MENLYLSKFSRKIIEQNMPKQIRKVYKNRGLIKVEIERTDKIHPLKRWGTEVTLWITKNGEIIYNSLVENTEEYWPEEGQKKSAARAVDYMLDGMKGADWVIK